MKKHFVVGTSGHIDHGKTTLVKALTGVDADRLAEEKARGITIDIGFAHYSDPDGTDFSFVDVPGHERFVHNMLAGASGLDAVMLVVAADEGVMPQTREHLQICDLLGISQGIIALNRVDLVDDEMLELSRADVEEAVAGTFLENAPVIPVSALKGTGLTELKAALKTLSATIPLRNTEHPFRFPVDRSFTLKGFGTVVTGTVLAGTLKKTDQPVQFPKNTPVRIRGIQVHGEEVQEVSAGQRAAINLTGISTEEIIRGDQLAATESLLTSYILNVEMRLLKSIPRDLTQRTRVRLHLGTREVLGRIVLLEEEAFAPGETQLIQIRLEKPISSRFGDRFIIRHYSPVYTLGGGRVIDPAPSKARRVQRELADRLKALAGTDPLALTEQAAYIQGIGGVKAGEGFLRTGMGNKSFEKVLSQLASQNKIVLLDPQEKKYVHHHVLERLGGFLEKVIDAYHKDFPDREGTTRAELVGKMATLFNEREVAAILTRLVKEGRLAQEGQTYQRPGHEKSLNEEDGTLLEQAKKHLQEGGMQPPRKTALLEALGLDEKKGMKLLKSAAHEKKLVRIKDDLYYTPEVLTQIREKLITHLNAQNQVTVIDFKDLVGVARKHAVDLLEYFDAEKLTLRLEDHRVLRNP